MSYSHITNIRYTFSLLFLLKRNISNWYVCVYVRVGVHIHTWRPEKGVMCPLYHSLLNHLRQSLSLNLELVFQLGQ